jgi:RimJ/RimL family protein N-acetyltransferase
VTDSIIIPGEVVRLRPLAKGDLRELAEWRNRHRHCFADPRRVTLAGQKTWFTQYERRPGDLMFIIEAPNGRAVGSVAIYNLDRKAGTAEFGRLMIGLPADERRGIPPMPAGHFSSTREASLVFTPCSCRSLPATGLQ